MAIVDLLQTTSQVDTKTIVGLVLLGFVASLTLDLFKKPPFPLVNFSPYQLTYHLAKIDYIRNARKLIKDGLEKFQGPIMLITDYGPKAVFPPSYLDEISGDDSFSMNEVASKELFGDYPGFDAFKTPPSGMFEEVVRVRITRNLPKFTKVLSDEMDLVLPETLGEDREWRDVRIKDKVLRIIAQISARIFVGEELARSPEWQKISIDYTTDAFIAASLLRLWPAVLRPVVHWVLPHCRRLRSHMRAGRRLLGSVLQARDDEKRKAVQAGTKPPVHFDSMEWFHDSAHGREYDPVSVQMALALASIHTTADLLTQAIYNLCLYPEMVPRLREEAVSVLQSGGWKKTSIFELRLMDSFLKETQRTKPISIVTMSRVALRDVTLADGTFIPKGTSLAVSSHKMWDPEVHANPTEFQGDRFLKMRETPGQEHKAHLVSTSVDHLAFSHGKHACPGRFFAANETKIALAHILLKYDLRLKEGKEPKPMEMGPNVGADPFAILEVKYRGSQVPLELAE